MCQTMSMSEKPENMRNRESQMWQLGLGRIGTKNADHLWARPEMSAWS